MSNVPHDIGGNKLYIDTLKLYESLVNFLKSEIAKNDNTPIDVLVGTDYSEEKNNEKAKFIIEDIKKL